MKKLTGLLAIFFMASLVSSVCLAQEPFSKPTHGWSAEGQITCNCTVDTGEAPTSVCGTGVTNACNIGKSCEELCKNSCNPDDVYQDAEYAWNCKDVIIP